MNILMAAPFDSKGRYKGGIMYVANSIYDELKKNNIQNIELIKFETCRIERSNKTNSKINLENVKNFLNIYRDLIPEVKKYNAEILYYHSSVKIALLKDILAIRKVKRKAKVKIIIHIHSGDFNQIMFSDRLVNKVIINMLNKYVDRIVFLSNKTANEFAENGLIKSKEIVIYNFHTLNYTKEQMQIKIGKFKEKHKIDMLFMGLINKRKGVFDVLQILNEIKGEIVFHICGSFINDEIENEFYRMIKNIGDNVIFHGYITGNEKMELLLNSDVLILPSYNEGLPIVIMEAFGAGCSVITTDVGAIPEIFKDNCGYMIKPGDIQKLKKCIQTIIDNKEICIQQMLHNYNYGKEFSVQNFLKDILDICGEY